MPTKAHWIMDWGIRVHTSLCKARVDRRDVKPFAHSKRQCPECKSLITDGAHLPGYRQTPVARRQKKVSRKSL